LTCILYYVDLFVFQICNGLASIDPLRHMHSQYILESKLCLLNGSSEYDPNTVSTDNSTSSELVPCQVDETTSWDWAINFTMSEWKRKNSIQRNETNFDIDTAQNNEVAKRSTQDFYTISRLYKTDPVFKEKLTQLLNDHQAVLFNDAKKALQKSGATNATISQNTKGAKKRLTRGNGA
jgi:hypothetical protein